MDYCSILPDRYFHQLIIHRSGNFISVLTSIVKFPFHVRLKKKVFIKLIFRKFKHSLNVTCKNVLMLFLVSLVGCDDLV